MIVDGFHWDGGNWPKCAQHGLSMSEIEAVLRSVPMVLPDRNAQLPETRFNAVGIGPEGRHVFVVFTFRDRDGTRLIRPLSARYMHRKEIDAYERTKEG
ncbi:MAG: hypothetical protein BGN87_03605 [Rhizobiales bacterium 65-79]|jgi:uncharacterized DUF497 family protein|nr:BrnT family toxin [Hyphomicrobiales bacterium]OJU04862.1 MAG: hypothetical protein BGN87_03605 [Rhizobiales bacterium 65-79]